MDSKKNVLNKWIISLIQPLFLIVNQYNLYKNITINLNISSKGIEIN